MPVITKEKHRFLRKELSDRFGVLLDNFDPRPLNNSKEGAGGRAHWVEPDNMVATIGGKISLSLAVEDFKTILAEIKKLK